MSKKLVDDMKYHYTYRITNIKERMYYYGVHSCDCHPKEDIGVKYWSSSKRDGFVKLQKQNPQDYKYKVIKIFSTRVEAIEHEIFLHEKFNVKNHNKFYNDSNQTSKGFRASNSLEYRAKVSIGINRVIKDIVERKRNTILENGNNILTQSALDGAKTKRETICENGKTIQENTSIKAVESRIKNDSYKTGSKKALETRKIKGPDGLTPNERGTIKSIETKYKLDENGLNSYDRMSLKCREKSKIYNIFNADNLLVESNVYAYDIKQQYHKVLCYKTKDCPMKGDGNNKFFGWYCEEIPKEVEVRDELILF